MKKLFVMAFTLLSTVVFAQTGNLMQGAGAINMSMGGASTAQPLDINSALEWNPAAVSVFNKKIITFDIGLFSSSPKLYYQSTSSSWGGGSTTEKVTKDTKGISVLPSFAIVFGNKSSRHTFGISIFSNAHFGVLFPENKTNPINYPPSYGGFGKLESNYSVIQIGATYAYKLSENFSVGVKPIIGIATFKVQPNPFAKPSPAAGYPNSNNAVSIGIGGQIGLFYKTGFGLKFGLSYKTQQYFSDFKFKNKYHSGLDAQGNTFKLNVPAILSAGLGFSAKFFDLAIDYRKIFYKNTTGYHDSGWNDDYSISGYGWNNVNVISAGLQLRLMKKFPLRLGYSFSSNPIAEQLVMFSMEMPAVIKNAFQIGAGYKINDKITINATYQYATSSGKTTGPLLTPILISDSNPYGAANNAHISYDNKSVLVVLGLSYTFDK